MSIRNNGDNGESSGKRNMDSGIHIFFYIYVCVRVCICIYADTCTFIHNSSLYASYMPIIQGQKP